MTRQYEYRQETIGPTEWEARCNELGERGWRLTGTLSATNGGATLCYFERIWEPDAIVKAHMATPGTDPDTVPPSTRRWILAQRAARPLAPK